MSLQEQISKKLASLNPEFCRVENESHRHHRGTETHYKIIVVSSQFDGQSRVQRARSVHEILKTELQSIHSLSSRLFSPREWLEHGDKLNYSSPSCQGQSEEA